MTQRHPVAWALALLGIAAWSQGAEARVTRIVVDDTQDLTATGQTIPYQQISGRAFGELDPREARSALITDIDLGKDADGKVRHVASFLLTKPKDMSQASGLTWHAVPNRGTPITIVVAERNFGDVGLASAWQGGQLGDRREQRDGDPPEHAGRRPALAAGAGGAPV